MAIDLQALYPRRHFLAIVPSKEMFRENFHRLEMLVAKVGKRLYRHLMRYSQAVGSTILAEMPLAINAGSLLSAFMIAKT